MHFSKNEGRIELHGAGGECEERRRRDGVGGGSYGQTNVV